MGAPYDPRYLQGIGHFNRGAFFEAHEVWEELWTDTEDPTRRFYQGLIQVAVCLHHFGRGNTRGARKLYRSSTAYLRVYGPRHAGLDVQRFLAKFQQCCADLVASTEPTPRIKLDPQQIPRIDLDGPGSSPSTGG
ncbi:MAG: DUF309 domain-containing protein [Pirellulaceae bacterium]